MKWHQSILNAFGVYKYRMKKGKINFKPLTGIKPHIFGLLVRCVNHYCSIASDTVYHCATETGWQPTEVLESISCHPYHYWKLTVKRLAGVLFSQIYKNNNTARDFISLFKTVPASRAFRHFVVFINKTVTQISVIFVFSRNKIG